MSALIRSGQINREEALNKMEDKVIFTMDDLQQIFDRLKISLTEFEQIWNAPTKSYRDYKTYSEYFQEHKDYFKDMLERGLIPLTFYTKYVEGVNE